MTELSLKWYHSFSYGKKEVVVVKNQELINLYVCANDIYFNTYILSNKLMISGVIEVDFFKDLFMYLKGKVAQREKQISSICWFTLKILRTAGPGPCQSQESEILSSHGSG